VREGEEVVEGRRGRLPGAGALVEAGQREHGVGDVGLELDHLAVGGDRLLCVGERLVVDVAHRVEQADLEVAIGGAVGVLAVDLDELGPLLGGEVALGELVVGIVAALGDPRAPGLGLRRCSDRRRG
jgi:hypothetical protein